MTEEQWISLIIAEIGGDTTDLLLATNLPIYWDVHADAPSDPARALLTKINGIDLLLGQTWRQVDFKALDGASVNLSDVFDHLKALREIAMQQLTASSASAAGGGIAVGALTTTAPIMPDRACGTDPNDRRFRGDPLRRPW